MQDTIIDNDEFHFLLDKKKSFRCSNFEQRPAVGGSSTRTAPINASAVLWQMLHPQGNHAAAQRPWPNDCRSCAHPFIAELLLSSSWLLPQVAAAAAAAAPPPGRKWCQQHRWAKVTFAIFLACFFKCCSIAKREKPPHLESRKAVSRVQRGRTNSCCTSKNAKKYTNKAWGNPRKCSCLHLISLICPQTFR